MMDTTSRCVVCGARKELYCCGACLTSVYCGAQCQAQDWRAGHPEFCLIAGKRKRETTLMDFPREIVFEIVQYLSTEKLKQFLEANDFFASRPSVLEYIYAHYVYELNSLENLPAWVYNFRNVRYNVQQSYADGYKILEIIDRFPFLQHVFTDNEILFEHGNSKQIPRIVNSLKYYNNLKQLIVSKVSHMGIEETSMLLEAFKSNPHIISFELTHADISGKALSTFVEMLQQNTTLVGLHLLLAGIYYNTLPLIFNALRHNTTLRNLWFEFMIETTDELLPFVDLMRHNKTILTLAIFDDVDISNINQDAIDEILFYLKRNNKLAGKTARQTTKYDLYIDYMYRNSIKLYE